jgi:hypothetical protein
VLGEGTYDVMAKVRYLHSSDTIAIKWFHRTDRDESYHHPFVREARCLSDCRGHSAVIQI